jgi:RNA polymerase sigma-70 factor (ECF subfamily)
LPNDRRTDSDLEVIQRVRAGDSAALAVALDRHWAAVVRYAATILGDADRAQDVAQECFIRFWERRETWALEGSVRGLLLRLTRNLALDEVRRAGARERAASRALPRSSPRTPEEETESADLRATIDSAVSALPPRRREVFLLVRAQGLTLREAAHVLGIAPQTAANHLSMALTSLRRALAPLVRPLA